MIYRIDGSIRHKPISTENIQSSVIKDEVTKEPSYLHMFFVDHIIIMYVKGVSTFCCWIFSLKSACILLLIEPNIINSIMILDFNASCAQTSISFCGICWLTLVKKLCDYCISWFLMIFFFPIFHLRACRSKLGKEFQVSFCSSNKVSYLCWSFIGVISKALMQDIKAAGQSWYYILRKLK